MTKKIIKNHEITDDNWVRINEADQFPADTGVSIIVPYQKWQAERETLLNRKAGLGVIIGNDISLQEIVDDIQHFDLIAIEFFEFKDGRGYSYAKLLRDRFGYKKEIRAVGNVLRDQLAYMQRCGINAFELADNHNMENALKAFSEFSVAYQPEKDYVAQPQ